MPRKPKSAGAATRKSPEKKKVADKPKEDAAPAEKSPKPSPKKASPKAKKAKPASKLQHPPYRRMIKVALKELDGGRSGSSVTAIANYIKDNYKVSDHHRRFIRQVLTRGEEIGDYVRVKSQTFRLSAKALHGKKKRSRSKSPRAAKEKEPKEPKEKKEKKGKKEKKEKASPKKRTKKDKAPKEGEKESPKKEKKEAKKKPSKRKEAPKGERPSKAKKSRAEPSKEAEADEITVNIPGSKYDYFWQFKSDFGWGNYDLKASDVLEEVYQGYLANRGDTDVRAVRSGQWEYQVDFLAMKQTNIQHEAHTIRELRRVKNTASKE